MITQGVFMETVISNIDKMPKLKLIYFNGCIKIIRGIKTVYNIRDKEIYFETINDVALKGERIPLKELRQWTITI